MHDFIYVMKALSEPNRVRMLKLMSRRPLCVCELTSLLGLAQPTVSKHVGILERAGLVRGKRERAWVLYEPDRERSRYAREMLEKLSGWLEDDEQLQELYTRLDTVDKRDLCAPGRPDRAGNRRKGNVAL
jgi:ArsR family transcriptional regulator